MMAQLECRILSWRVICLRLRELQCCHVATGSLIHKNENLRGHDDCVWVTFCAFNGTMCCMLPWELRCVLGGNRSESGMIIQSCQPLQFLGNPNDFLFFIMPLCPYSENYDKSAFSRNSSIWCSFVTVLAIHCITWLACLYFREYPQAIACSAQPLWCSSHGSCPRLHGLKALAVPVNQNGAFFPGQPWILWGWCLLPMQEILSFVQSFLIQR